MVILKAGMPVTLWSTLNLARLQKLAQLSDDAAPKKKKEAGLSSEILWVCSHFSICSSRDGAGSQFHMNQSSIVPSECDTA